MELNEIEIVFEVFDFMDTNEKNFLNKLNDNNSVISFEEVIEPNMFHSKSFQLPKKQKKNCNKFYISVPLSSIKMMSVKTQKRKNRTKILLAE